MPRINILDDSTIDKIAAGEVIERPSSVVKELVENAIDSGADSISVEIKEGGISYIRVTDNGCGILREDVKNAFLRHATSKIKDVLDLFKISSLGFRGEALSSISAVASVELLTKTANDFSGIRYVISGGREEAFEDAGIPDGTTIIVRNLFYNTPARRKFLKSPNTEASYITELMEHLILSHPEISFKYTVNGIDRMISSGNDDIKSTVYTVFGRETIKNMLPVSVENDICKITGLIGKPEISRGNRNYEYFFVNKRYIKSSVLSYAVESSYKSRLMLHKYPFVILYFEINPEKLDINVHPAKTEIKFIDEIALSKLITDEIDYILSESELIPQISDSIIKPKPVENPIEHEPVCITKAPDSIDKFGLFSNEKAPEPFEEKRVKEIRAEAETITDKIENVQQIDLFKDTFISEKAVKKHKIIGQIFLTYWLVQYEDNLYIIDQHAAHEKVLYEKLIKRLSSSQITSQMISPPVIVSLSAKEEDVLNKYGANIRNVGFEWENFGGQEYSICSVPTDLFNLSCKDYFIAVLDDLAEGRNQTLEAVNDRIASMACKAAVKGNMRMSEEEARALINELLELENPYNCPHGRPCIISYSKEQIEKLFKRIV